eukprot:gene14229-biopygen1902
MRKELDAAGGGLILKRCPHFVAQMDANADRCVGMLLFRVNKTLVERFEDIPFEEGSAIPHPPDGGPTSRMSPSEATILYFGPRRFARASISPAPVADTLAHRATPSAVLSGAQKRSLAILEQAAVRRAQCDQLLPAELAPPEAGDSGGDTTGSPQRRGLRGGPRGRRGAREGRRAEEVGEGGAERCGRLRRRAHRRVVRRGRRRRRGPAIADAVDDTPYKRAQTLGLGAHQFA